MKRLEALSKLLGVEEGKFGSRETTDPKFKSEDWDEFYLTNEDGETIYYDVLKKEEEQGRLDDLLNECYAEEELQEWYGGDTTLADIDVYLKSVGTIGQYTIYTAL